MVLTKAGIVTPDVFTVLKCGEVVLSVRQPAIDKMKD